MEFYTGNLFRVQVEKDVDYPDKNIIKIKSQDL